MKKSILTIIISVFAIGSLFSQSYTVYDTIGIVSDTVYVYGDPSSSELFVELNVMNNTNIGSNIKVSRNEISLPENTSSYFKWVQTYGVETDVSEESFYVPAGGSSPTGMFIGYYEPNEVIGVSVIEYTFFNMDNQNDSVSVLVKFNTTTDNINENLMADISNIYPNPAVNYVCMDYNLTGEVENASVEIINLLGSVVKEQQLHNGMGKLKINISELEPGIFFYFVTINKKAYLTRKLVVK